MEFNVSRELQLRLKEIVDNLRLPHLDHLRIICFKSTGSSSRATARIWSLPKIWQKALKVEAHYCIEVISERFYRLSPEEQTKVLIHELMHIPKNFSGALLPHRGRGRIRINSRTVNYLFEIYKKNSETFS